MSPPSRTAASGDEPRLSFGVEMEFILLIIRQEYPKVEHLKSYMDKENKEFTMEKLLELYPGTEEHLIDLLVKELGRGRTLLHAGADDFPAVADWNDNDEEYGQNPRQDWAYNNIIPDLNDYILTHPDLGKDFTEVKMRIEYNKAEEWWTRTEGAVNPATKKLKVSEKFYFARENYAMTQVYGSPEEQDKWWGPFLPIGLELVSDVRYSRPLSKAGDLVGPDTTKVLRAMLEIVRKNWSVTVTGPFAKHPTKDEETKTRTANHVHVGLDKQDFTTLHLKKMGTLMWITERWFMGLHAPWRRRGYWTRYISEISIAAKLAKGEAIEPDQTLPEKPDYEKEFDLGEMSADKRQEMTTCVPEELAKMKGIEYVWGQKDVNNTARILSRSLKWDRCATAFRELCYVEPGKEDKDIRYKKTNLGTMEWRCAAGTLDPDRVAQWAEVCLRFVVIVYSFSDAEFKELIQKILNLEDTKWEDMGEGLDTALELLGILGFKKEALDFWKKSSDPPTAFPEDPVEGSVLEPLEPVVK